VCPHDEFDIIYYENNVLVRRCKLCGEVEVKFDYWTRLENIRAMMKALEGK